MPKLNPKSDVTRFFNAIEKHPGASLYILCDLLLRSCAQSKHDINAIAKKISTRRLRKVIAHMLDIEENKRALHDKSTLLSFTKFKIELMSNKVWGPHLESKDIIALSANDEFYLYGLIALTRKHLLIGENVDPFHSFNFEILLNASVEHIGGEISKLLASCMSLPLEDFKEIAKGDIALARGVLLLLQSHSARFEMGEYFLLKHPELKKELYENWKNTKESIALTNSSEAFLATNVESVAKTHPEFSKILTAGRVKKDMPDSKHEVHKYDYNFKGLTGLGSFLITAKLIPEFAVLTKAAILGQACAAMAAPLFMPASLAFISGFMAYKIKPVLIDKSEKKTTSPVTPWSYKLFQ